MSYSWRKFCLERDLRDWLDVGKESVLVSDLVIWSENIRSGGCCWFEEYALISKLTRDNNKPTSAFPINPLWFINIPLELPEGYLVMLLCDFLGHRQKLSDAAVFCCDDKCWRTSFHWPHSLSQLTCSEISRWYDLRALMAYLQASIYTILLSLAIVGNATVVGVIGRSVIMAHGAGANSDIIIINMALSNLLVTLMRNLLLAVSEWGCEVCVFVCVVVYKCRFSKWWTVYETMRRAWRKQRLSFFDSWSPLIGCVSSWWVSGCGCAHSTCGPRSFSVRSTCWLWDERVRPVGTSPGLFLRPFWRLSASPGFSISCYPLRLLSSPLTGGWTSQRWTSTSAHIETPVMDLPLFIPGHIILFTN